MAVSTRPKRPGMAGPPSDGKRPRRPAAPPRRQPLRILLGPSTPTGDLGEDTALLLGSLAARYLSFAFICIHKLLSTPGWLWPVRSEADDRAAGGPERAGACRRPAPGQRRRGPFGGRQPGANGRRGRPRAGRRRPGRPVPGPLEPLGERARGPRRRPDRGGQPPAGGRRRIPRDRPDRAPGVAMRPGAGHARTALDDRPPGSTPRRGARAARPGPGTPPAGPGSFVVVGWACQDPGDVRRRTAAA